MSVVYCNKVIINNGVNDFEGIVFESDTDKHAYIEGRIVPFSKLKEMAKNPNWSLRQVSSVKLPPMNSLIVFKNGANNTIGSIDRTASSYRVKGGGGYFGQSDITYQLAYTYSRVLSDNIKIYKIEGMKIN